MKINKAEYIGSFGADDSLPSDGRPEFVFVGRSNVGKSSLINSLVARRSLARTSNTPGKTRTANYYLINDAFYFVDMPGYGYAKVSKKERADWTRMIEVYLTRRKTLLGVVQLMDVRHKPSRSDTDTSARLKLAQAPFCVVFNKVDKVKRARIAAEIAAHLDALSLEPATAVVPFSARSPAGNRELWSWIDERLSL